MIDVNELFENEYLHIVLRGEGLGGVLLPWTAGSDDSDIPLQA